MLWFTVLLQHNEQLYIMPIRPPSRLIYIVLHRDPNLQFVEQPALQPPEFVINQADQQVRVVTGMYFGKWTGGRLAVRVPTSLQYVDSY